MKISVRTGALAVAVAAGAALVTPLALPATAAPAKQSAACSKVNAPPLGPDGKLKSTFAACTPAALKAGGNSIVKPGTGATSGKLVSTITWKGGKGTTIATLKYAPAKTKGKCPAGTGRVTITGTVTGGKGVAATIIKKGEKVTGSVCAIQKAGPNLGKTVIEPGTKYKM